MPLYSAQRFQPTLPLRGATPMWWSMFCRPVFQPTLPLRGATIAYADAKEPEDVSTHSPLAGSDQQTSKGLEEFPTFQPTLPLRGATPRVVVREVAYLVSTHAPLAGSDILEASQPG